MHTPRRALFVLLLLLGFLSIAAGISLALVRPPAFHGLPFEKPIPAPEFALTDQHGQTVRLSDYRGKVVVLFFGFTHCTVECPITLATFKRVAARLGDDVARVRFVFITVDPQRDTPARLGEFLAQFDPTFVGLTGSLEEIEDVARAYTVFFNEIPVTPSPGAHIHADGTTHLHDAEDAYLVNHTTLVQVIDQTGMMRLVFPYEARADAIAADLERLLR